MAADQDFNLNVEMETLFSKSGSDYHDLDVKLEDDEEDELGPIVDTPFRARCYTWPRQYLQQQQGQATSPSFRNSCFLIFIVVTFKKRIDDRRFFYLLKIFDSLDRITENFLLPISLTNCHGFSQEKVLKILNFLVRRHHLHESP